MQSLVPHSKESMDLSTLRKLKNKEKALQTYVQEASIRKFRSVVSLYRKLTNTFEFIRVHMYQHYCTHICKVH